MVESFKFKRIIPGPWKSKKTYEFFNDYGEQIFIYYKKNNVDLVMRHSDIGNCAYSINWINDWDLEESHWCTPHMLSDKEIKTIQEIKKLL
jgi:hypothetical protein